MKALVICLSILVSSYAVAQRKNYGPGDTLRVFTVGGLKLRESGSQNAKVLATMRLGEPVIILDTVSLSKSVNQKIEGFSGSWIRVKYDSLEGYAFDGFLSALPVPEALSFYADSLKKDWVTYPGSVTYEGQNIGLALKLYIHSNFQSVCEPVEYFNGSDGESYEVLFLEKLNNGFTEISRGGWEGFGTELVMPGVRLEEVKNLIVLLSVKSDLRPSLVNDLKENFKSMPEYGQNLFGVLSLPEFWITLKKYPKNNTWAVKMDSATD